MAKASNALAVIVALAHDANDELIIITSAAQSALDKISLDHPARREMWEAMASAVRLGDAINAALKYAERNGGKRTSIRTEQAIANE